MIKILKQYVGFHYLLTEIKLDTLNLWELNIFHKKYQTKSEENQLLTIYWEHKITNLLCVDFIVSLSYNIWFRI